MQAEVKAPEQKTGFLASVTKPFRWLSPKPAAKPSQPLEGRPVALVCFENGFLNLHTSTAQYCTAAPAVLSFNDKSCPESVVVPPLCIACCTTSLTSFQKYPKHGPCSVSVNNYIHHCVMRVTVFDVSVPDVCIVLQILSVRLHHGCQALLSLHAVHD